MACKAAHFGDLGSVRKLQEEGLSAKACKEIGRRVEGFTVKEWDAAKRNVMFEVVLAKFTQNKGLAELLIRTGERRIVEASPFDYVWGAGMKEEEIRAGGEWIGCENLLGIVLERVRVELRPADDDGAASLTPAGVKFRGR